MLYLPNHHVTVTTLEGSKSRYRVRSRVNSRTLEITEKHSSEIVPDSDEYIDSIKI